LTSTFDFDFAQLREIIDDVPPGRQAGLGPLLSVLHGRTIFMLVGNAGVRRPLPYGSYSFGEAATRLTMLWLQCPRGVGSVNA
jgi:hypothetical protein